VIDAAEFFNKIFGKKHGCQAYTVDREPQKQISKIVSDLDLSNV